MSELKVNKISPRSGTTVTIGDSGDTTNIVGTLNNNGATLLSLANGVDNRVITSSSATALNGEANLTFDGSTLGVNGAAIFNESGADKDFRVESDGNANMLFVDGGTNRVGIGEDVPLGLLHIKSGDSGVTPNVNADDLFIENNGAAGITIGSSTNEKGNIFFADSGNALDGYIQYAHDTRYLRFATAGTERVRIHSNGVLSAANGIALGVGTANTASNVLDDYEEGTWTPVYEGSSSNPTITYDGFTNGTYNKIGNMVFARGYIRTDATSGGSGGLLIAGFPFNFASGAYTATILTTSTFGWSTQPAFTLNDSNADTVNLYDASGNGLTTSNLTNAANKNVISFLAVYQV
mgnify:CR=1 FL=1